MARRQLTTFRIPGADWWSPGEEVIARDVTEGDMAWVQNQVNKVPSINAKTQDAHIDVLAGEARILLLVRCIVSWTLIEENRQGQMVDVPMPPYSDDKKVLAIRRKSIASLAPEDSAYLYGKLTERSTPMTVEEQEHFLLSAVNGSVESQE